MSNRLSSWWRAVRVPPEKRLSAENLSQLLPWVAYPLAMISREDASGSNWSIFDWITQRSDVSIFDVGSIILAIVFVFVFTTAYVLIFLGREKRRFLLIILISFCASSIYFALVYLAVKLEPETQNFCNGNGRVPYCLSFFEHGLLMAVSITVAKSACLALLRRSPKATNHPDSFGDL